MNSKFPRRTGLPRENPPHARCSPSAVMAIEDDGTIGMTKGVARCESPLLAHQLSVFFAPTGYRVVKITCSYSEVVLQTMNYKAHYSSSCFRPLLRGNSPMSSVFLLKKKNNVIMR
jgi:hypothetical protein